MTTIAMTANFLYLEGRLPSCGKVIDAPDCSLRKMGLEGGADDRNRTGDLRVTSALLYRLSYIGLPAGIISGESASRQRLTPKIGRNVERLRCRIDRVQQHLHARRRHGHAVAVMAAVDIQFGQLRMTPDGGNVAGRTGAQTGPVLDYRHVAQG